MILLWFDLHKLSPTNDDQGDWERVQFSSTNKYTQRTEIEELLVNIKPCMQMDMPNIFKQIGYKSVAPSPIMVTLLILAIEKVELKE